MNLFRRKTSLTCKPKPWTDQSLKRALGPVNLTALGIGAIIGDGHLRADRDGRRPERGAGGGALVCLGGAASVFAALCYAEFASLVPMSGSAYTYGYATLGELFAWIIGWDLVLEYAVGAITVRSAGRAM